MGEASGQAAQADSDDESSDEDDMVEDLPVTALPMTAPTIRGARYIQQATGRKVRDSDVQTGGIGGRVVRAGAPRRKDGPTLLDVTNKMRYAVTIMEGLEMRPHLR